jgi:hypothetical protein
VTYRNSELNSMVRDAEAAEMARWAKVPNARRLKAEIDAESLPYYERFTFNDDWSALTAAWGRCKDAQESGVDLDDDAQAEIVSIIKRASRARAGA